MSRDKQVAALAAVGLVSALWIAHQQMRRRSVERAVKQAKLAAFAASADPSTFPKPAANAASGDQKLYCYAHSEAPIALSETGIASCTPETVRPLPRPASLSLCTRNLATF